jgi:sulfur carrier protein
MKIVVNGEDREIADGTTVEELLNSLKIKDKTMATAIDMKVIKQDKWKTRVIQDGEKIEFLHFVGGG